MATAVIYVRSSVDWANMTFDNYLHQEGLAPGVRDYLVRLKPKVAMWNATFRMSYFDFRRRLQDIHHMNLGAVRGIDAIVKEFTMLQWMAWADASSDMWVLPIDDDDWYAPDLGTLVRQFPTPNYHMQYWPIIRYIASRVPGDDEPTVSVQRPYANYDFMLTNMYALGSGGVCNVPGKERKKMLTHHGCSVQKMSGFNHPFTVPPVPDEVKAVTLKSPASITQMLAAENQAALLHLVDSGLQQEADIQGLPVWAQPYATMALDVLRELKESVGVTL